MTHITMPETAHVGRVGLRVAAVDDLLPFYRDVVGLTVDREEREGREGRGATLSAAGRPLVELTEAPQLPPRAD